MSKYTVSEPSALKFLKANGAVVDENGNVVNEASDYWKKVYEQAEPKVAKYLHADGTIDENPGSGGGGADLENNKTATIDVSTYTEPVEITPTEGKDGMKKATVTLSNIPSETPLFVFPNSGGGSTILPVATFEEIEIGMKAYSCSKTSGVLFMGTVTELDEEQGYLIEQNEKPSYFVYINSEETSIPFPSFGD